VQGQRRCSINALGRREPPQHVLFFFKNSEGVLQEIVTFCCECKRSRGSSGGIKYDEKKPIEMLNQTGN